MSLKLWNTEINKLYLWTVEILWAYLWSVLVFEVVSWWDLTNASYDSVSFSVSSQIVNPRWNITFSTDWTKCYMADFDSTNWIHQYSLSTAWDISSMSYSGIFLNVLSVVPNPTWIFFKPDWTKMYVLCLSNRICYQYSLSSAWDVSTASYDGVSFSVSSQQGTPRQIFFKPDWTKLYLIWNSPTRIHQYSLSIAWDVSTASYDNVFFSISQDTAPLSFFFKPDWTKLFIVWNTNDTFFQYSLSIAWDISTTTYDSVSFSVSTQDTAPYSIWFKDDWTKMYMLWSTNSSIFQYSI